MTYEKARLTRVLYYVLSVLAAAIGISMIIATLWASIEQDPNPFPPFKVLTKLLELLNDKIHVIGWLKYLVPNTPGYPAFLNPFYVCGFLLVLFARYLLRNSRVLKSWMVEVKSLIEKESILNSIRLKSRAAGGASSNTIGGVYGGDVHQEIANYFNHRPDSPRHAVIIAIIGAVVSAVLGPIVGIWLGKG
jgi:hypothetical protein